ncbi:arylsulfatase B [Monosiga brevicollis MX1]|uniref:Arylsulfatase B n=1 Tax=Monosiga brevicollis TaxID=81824 RepID=A9UVD7_MONBE|nr:arylsulfatase B [Monosiga brevicollis MX1]EDQ90563.1 arylsulfatase B [Monosiga brevicollis MX1]|eukprot:XP_001744614.1 arylsulfatase B [Monosiga brevicollis MX1]
MLPKKLKTAGYATHQVGKWHLGQTHVGNTPVGHGFDSSFGYLGGAEDHWNHTNGGCDCGTAFDMWNSTAPAYSVANDGIYGDEHFWRHAERIIEAHDPAQPLFMYIALQTMHAPQEVPSAYSTLYNGTENFNVEQGMATFADEVYGNVTAALKAKGMWDNLLLVLILVVDEKVSGSMANNYPLRGGKRTAWEGGMRVNSFVQGGLLPQAALGTEKHGYIHVADW